jgi:hypothetical protein
VKLRRARPCRLRVAFTTSNEYLSDRSSSSFDAPSTSRLLGGTRRHVRASDASASVHNSRCSTSPLRRLPRRHASIRRKLRSLRAPTALRSPRVVEVCTDRVPMDIDDICSCFTRSLSRAHRPLREARRCQRATRSSEQPPTDVRVNISAFCRRGSAYDEIPEVLHVPAEPLVRVGHHPLRLLRHALLRDASFSVRAYHTGHDERTAFCTSHSSAPSARRRSAFCRSSVTSFLYAVFSFSSLHTIAAVSAIAGHARPLDPTA